MVPSVTHATTALAPPPPAVAHRPAVRRRPGLLGALGLFVLARLAGAGVLAGVAWAAGKRPLRLLGHSWDSRWYLGIAEHGYGRTLRFGPDVVHSDLAFFPLYPALVRAVTAVTPLGAGSAGLLVSWTAAALAACGIYAVTRHLRGPAVAAATVLLWGLLPHSVVLSMAYTEPVLTAFAAWALYAVLTGRWVWAGALAAAAGVSRPNGFAVAAAVVVAGGCEAVRAWGWGMAGAEGRPPLGRDSGGTLARGWGRGMAGAEGRAPRGHGFGPGSEGSRAREGSSTGAWPSRARENGTEVSRPGGGPGLGEAVRARGCVPGTPGAARAWRLGSWASPHARGRGAGAVRVVRARGGWGAASEEAARARGAVGRTPSPGAASGHAREGVAETPSPDAASGRARGDVAETAGAGTGREPGSGRAVRARGRDAAVPVRAAGSARAVRGGGTRVPYAVPRARVSHRLWTGIALAPLGWIGYVLWVGVRKGDPLGGYFAVQRLWGSRFDFGEGSLRFARHLLLEGDRFVFPVALVIVGAAVVLYALLLAERVPLPLLVYTGVLLLIALGGSGFFESKPRFLLPAFPLLLPLAAALARTTRARPWHAAVVVAALAGLSFAYGAYLVVLADTPL